MTDYNTDVSDGGLAAEPGTGGLARGRGCLAGGRAAAAPGQAPALAPVPPPTNRGVLTPSSIEAKGLDYLRLTAFFPCSQVINVIESVIVERFGLTVLGGFEDQGQVGRMLGRYTCGIPTLQVEDCGDYSGVILKGQACSALGLECVLAIVAAVEGTGERWHCTRADFAWDGVPWTVREFYDRIAAGDVRTRATLTPSEMNILTPGNSTAYTHDRPGMRGVERYALCYDMRGPVRLETRLLGRHAKALGPHLASATPREAIRLGLELTRGLMDLLEPGDTRADRRELWGPWAEFIQDAGRWTPGGDQAARDSQGLELVGDYDGAIQRASRRLCEAADAFGIDWVIARLEHHGQGRQDLARVDRLMAVRSEAAAKRVAGVPGWPVESDVGDVPF